MPILVFLFIFAPSILTNNLKLTFMIQIKVFVSESCFKCNKVHCEWILKDATYVSCTTLIDAFKQLYGKDIVVQFNYLPL